MAYKMLNFLVETRKITLFNVITVIYGPSDTTEMFFSTRNVKYFHLHEYIVKLSNILKHSPGSVSSVIYNKWEER